MKVLAPTGKPRDEHLNTGVGCGPQQYKLPSPLEGAPGGVLYQVNALLVGQPRHHRYQGHIRIAQIHLLAQLRLGSCLARFCIVCAVRPAALQPLSGISKPFQRCLCDA